MPCDWTRTPIGRTGLSSSRLGLGSSFGLAAEDIEYAYERGINYFYWGSARRTGFGNGVKRVARGHREDIIVVVQSYTRVASLMGASLDSALRRLAIDYTDFLLLGWWNDAVPRRILDSALALREAGRCRHIMVSCHHRASFATHARTEGVDALMVRYNAAHPGAEQDVFPTLPDDRPGLLAYTATSWGDLLNPTLIPEGEAAPRPSDCYRFALTNPNIQVCMAGPGDREQLDEALAALDRGVMDQGELDWMKRVGAHVKTRTRPNSGLVSLADWIMGAKSP